MLAGRLLLRGLLCGVLAGVVAVGFAAIFGEPQLQLALDFESAVASATGVGEEPELVSRAMQGSLGLLTAGALAGLGVGGLFSLVFAACYRRIGRFSPRSLAALLALAGFVAVVLVPELKYPASPPSVGSAATIGPRTAVYFEMLVVSLAAMTLSVIAARRLERHVGAWNASLLAAALFVLVVGGVQLALPDFNEVPDGFPAVVLWRFRLAALGMQMMLWTTLGLAFGALAERVFAEPRVRQALVYR